MQRWNYSGAREEAARRRGAKVRFSATCARSRAASRMLRLASPAFSFFAIARSGVIANVSVLRRRGDWRRTQWTCERRLSGEGGKKGFGAGAPWSVGRRGGDRRDRAGISVLGVFVRGVVAAAGDYSRAGFAAIWVGDIAAGRDFFADAQRRLFVASKRSRQDAAGNPAAFAAGRGGVRRIFEDDDADVPVREAAAVDDSAGPDDAESEGLEAAAFFATEVSVAVVG